MSWKLPHGGDVHEQETDQDRAMDDVMSAFVFILLIIAAALLMIYTPTKLGGTSVSQWAPGIPLRFESRRDFNLTGTTLDDFTCEVVSGVHLGEPGHFGRDGKLLPEFKALYKKRPPECSRADQDLYVRYIEPNGKVHDVLSMDSPNQMGTAEGAFAYSEANRWNLGENTPNPFRDVRVVTPFRLEELTYRNKYLKPGTYIFNVHLQRGDDYFPDEPVKVAVYLIAFEGTTHEQVIFGGFVDLRMDTPQTRERTIATFKVDDAGQIIPGSIDTTTQTSIIEALAGNVK
ncbi:MAG: hypothetical protein GC134_05680 [Proteobacteria bacterium]|nr:hypothetical protein [Pseudomonadota bacterium]